MMKRYNAVMERLKITEEMRRRILYHVQQEVETPSAGRSRFWDTKLNRYLSLAACVVVLLAGTFVLKETLFVSPNSPPNVQAPSDFIEDVASMEELSEKVGFPVEELSTLPFQAETRSYTSYWGELAQVIYSGEGQSATFRKSVDSTDNSGDFTEYPTETQLELGDISATLRGKGKSFTLAVWFDGNYAYSLSLSEGVSAESWADILSWVSA